MDFIDEPDVLLYLANDMTHAFADPGFGAGVWQFFRISLGAKSSISELVSLAKNNAHRAPSTSTTGHVQRARDMVGRTTFDCLAILLHVRDAMAPESRILINYVILPDKRSTLIQGELLCRAVICTDMLSFAAFDIGMLMWLSANERSETLWKQLVTQAGGLEIENFWQAPGLRGEGNVEVVRTS
jgi:hypothetical protein